MWVIELAIIILIDLQSSSIQPSNKNSWRRWSNQDKEAEGAEMATNMYYYPHNDLMDV